MASRQRLKTAFKKAKVIAPLHTSGPVAITKDGTRLITCVGEQVLCTDIASGAEICRFKGVSTGRMHRDIPELTNRKFVGQLAYHVSDRVSVFDTPGCILWFALYEAL